MGAVRCGYVWLGKEKTASAVAGTVLGGGIASALPSGLAIGDEVTP